jgi:predicted metalloendopeptidase
MTLGENMADNGGLQRALEAYDIFRNSFFASEDELGDYEGAKYTAEQLFFISFAQIWCHVPDKSANGTDSSKVYFFKMYYQNG